MNIEQLGLIKIVDSLDEPHSDWGLKAINAHKVWDKTKGEGVKMLVIDTGMDVNHKDLKHAFKLGINMFERTTDITDDFGHGTHVAGLIAGLNTGVAPNVDLYIAKVLNNNGEGSMGSIMDGITFAMNTEVDILCMSLGTPNGLPPILIDRIEQAYQSGITIVCATGNNGADEPQYPAFMDEVIGVGGIDKELKITPFSNRGEDILAPSVEVMSTHKDGKYALMTGTSMASPIVAGAIALLISHNRKKGIELSPLEVKNIISKYEILDLEKLLN